MANEIKTIIPRGVERNLAPVNAEDGSALESINLRPTESGLELVHEKAVCMTAEIADGNLRGIFRHRGLPAKHYIFMYGDEDEGRWSLHLYKAEPDNNGNLKLNAYDDICEYDEPILSLGELNNILIVRTENAQDYYVWYEGFYEKMPPVAMPKQMTLEQDFDKSDPATMFDRPFFEAVVGVPVPWDERTDDEKDDDKDEYKPWDYSIWDKQLEEGKEKAVKLVQSIRAEEEMQQRRLGNFVGHVLVRCAFKTPEDNYISYGPVLHTEVGAYPAINRRSKFPTNESQERGAKWWERLYHKLVDDAVGASANVDINIAGEKAEGLRWLYPIAEFKKGQNMRIMMSVGEISKNAGFSQPPIYVGRIIDDVLFAEGDAVGDDEEKLAESSKWLIKNGLLNTNFKASSNKKPLKKYKNARGCLGVYAPSVIYSHPVLKIKFTKAQYDALRFYKKTKLMESFVIAMTAPVKHGYGNSLFPVREISATVNYQDVGPDNWNGNAPTDITRPIMSVYGYPTNYDLDPEHLMDKQFYIVKDISLEDLFEKIERKNDGDGVYYSFTCPLQLAELGVKAVKDVDGRFMVQTDTEEVAYSQEEQIDPNRVSLSMIEMAKPLPTDNFTNHTLLGNSLLEYNRRMHMFGVKTLFGDGFIPSSSIPYDTDGFGANQVVHNENSPYYFEVEIEADNKKILKRIQIVDYLTDQAGETMICSDIITYPDYRAKIFRFVKKVGDTYYCLRENVRKGETSQGKLCQYETRNSLLNNLAYHANTTDKIYELPNVELRGIRTNGNVDEEYYGAPVRGAAWFRREQVRYLQNYFDMPALDSGDANAGGWGQTHSWQKNVYAFKDDDTLIYEPLLINIKDNPTYRVNHDANIELSGAYEEGNRVQCSAQDDIFYFPSKNSYRAGSLDNIIKGANSVFSQVTEQKFGMFPLYLFSKEGIFTMEQGEGEILYANVAKINEDCVVSEKAICNAGEMVAYVVADGLRLIAGKEPTQVSDKADGSLFVKLHKDGEPTRFDETIQDFIKVLSARRLPEEIRNARLFYDSYNHEVLMLCDEEDDTREGSVLWAFNGRTKQFYKRYDEYCDRSVFFRTGIVQNDDNILWAIKRKEN